MALCAILLAAGESRRMGFPKPLLKIGNDTFLEKLARAMLGAADRLIVVIGAHAERVRPAVPRDPRITVADNPEWQRGQLSSIKAGLRAIGPACDGVIVHLTDHPAVAPETFAAVADAWRSSGKPIVIARHKGRRGHPVLFDRSVFAELLAAPEDQGARAVVNVDPGRVMYVDVDDPGVTLDLDTPEDLRRAGIELPRR